jgi:hypothetical protein
MKNNDKRYTWEIADLDDGHIQVFGDGTTAMIFDSQSGGIIAYCHEDRAIDIVIGLSWLAL